MELNAQGQSTMTPRQRTIVMSLFVIAVLATAAWLFATVMAQAACHHYSIWSYPWPQRCFHVVQLEAPVPPAKPAELEPPEPDIPLPLMDTQFPADCDLSWCDRLKGIGLLRDKLGTN